jgi:hypothetical protein
MIDLVIGAAFAWLVPRRVWGGGYEASPMGGPICVLNGSGLVASFGFGLGLLASF